jgi:hypothetical protein
VAQQQTSWFASLAKAMSSWRTAAVVLLSFSSVLPLGLVLYSIPDWMRNIGVANLEPITRGNVAYHEIESSP